MACLIVTICADDETFSIYIHCKSLRSPVEDEELNAFTGGLTNPAPGVFDFEDWRALQPIFDAAKLAGIFVILRPGPYVRIRGRVHVHILTPRIY